MPRLNLTRLCANAEDDIVYALECDEKINYDDDDDDVAPQMAGMPGLAIGGGGGPDGQLLDEYDSLIDPFGRDGWDSPEPDIHIECLMPSGIVVPLDVLKDETLENIKQVGRWVALFTGGGGVSCGYGFAVGG